MLCGSNLKEKELNQAAAQYSTKGTNEVAEFLDDVGSAMRANDSGASAGQRMLDSIKAESGVTAPGYLGKMLDKAEDEGQQVALLDAVAAGIGAYKAAHGIAPTADVVEAALQQGFGASSLGKDPVTGMILDSVLNTANSNFHDPQSLQPNRAVIAILSAFTEAIPFAGYLPVDIGSNEGKLAILSHQADSDYGDYRKGGIMDGTSLGDVYASSSRFIKLDISGTAPFTGKFTSTNLTSAKGYTDPAGTGVPVLRGRTRVYVNGKVAGQDAFQGNAASNPISGSVVLDGVTYTTSGTVTVATGAVSVSFSPALPAGSLATVQGFVDYETAPALIPVVGVRADTFSLFANPWRVMTKLGIDSKGQLNNELGLDGNSEALIATRNQMSMERHYQALRMVGALGLNNKHEFDFEWAARSQQMNRAQIFQDLQAKFFTADQRMANLTMDHGITHCYVGAVMAGILTSLPRDIFEPSGVSARPGIYRLGRLFGKYDFYYSPKDVYEAEDGSEAQIVCAGRSSQVARNPIILGDAIAPTFLDLNMQDDLKTRSAIYARDFTEVNPHEPSALGCALITVKNLG